MRWRFAQSPFILYEVFGTLLLYREPKLFLKRHNHANCSLCAAISLRCRKAIAYSPLAARSGSAAAFSWKGDALIDPRFDQVVGYSKVTRGFVRTTARAGRFLFCRGRLRGEEHPDRLAVVEAGGDGGEAGHLVADVEGERLDHQSFAGEVELHARQLPLAAVHVALLQEDGTAFVEAAEDAPSKIDAGDEMGAQADKAVLRRLHPDVAGHAAEDLRLEVGRVPVGVGREGEMPARQCGLRRGRRSWFAGNLHVRSAGDSAAVRAHVAVEEGVRQQAEELVHARLILLLVLLAMLLHGGIGGEGVEAVDLILTGRRAEEMAVGGDDQGHVALRGFNNVLEYIVAVVLLVEQIAKGAVIGVLGEALADRAADEGVGLGGG